MKVIRNVVLGLIALFVLGYFTYPPVRLFALVVAGRSPQCPLPQAIKCVEHQKQMTREKDRILAGTKVLQRDPKGFDQYETPSGRYWIPAEAKVSYMLPFNLAEQAMNIYGTGEQAVRKGDVVLDCGANIGVFAKSSLDAGAAKVIAIEPGPENVESLRRNFPAEIAAGRLVIVPKGVWDKEDVLSFRVDPTNSAADSFVIERKSATQTIQIPVTTIDRLADELKLERVDYIKMDIEGAEPQALRGAANVIRKWKPRLSISAYHADDHPVLLPKIIRETRPDYSMFCGPCAEANGGIRPDILWFR